MLPHMVDWPVSGWIFPHVTNPEAGIDIAPQRVEENREQGAGDLHEALVIGVVVDRQCFGLREVAVGREQCGDVASLALQILRLVDPAPETFLFLLSGA